MTLELYAASVVLAAALLINRLLTPVGAHGRPHTRPAALVVLAVLAGIWWVAHGPGHAGWSAIAGRGL